MTPYLTWAAALILTGTAALPAYSQMQAMYFEFDGKCVYDVSGAKPGSLLAFYQQQDGGKLLQTQLLDPQGHAQVVADHGFQPAFVLNTGTVQHPGNNQVIHFGQPEFSLDHIDIKQLNGSYSLSWAAAFRQPKQYVIELLRATDDRRYSAVYQATPAGTWTQQYRFEEEAHTDKASYKIRVSNTEKGWQYDSRIFRFNAVAPIKVYPTTAADRIFIDAADKKVMTYEISSLSGQINLKGNGSKDGITTVTVSDLLPGQYLLLIRANDQQLYTARFTKN